MSSGLAAAERMMTVAVSGRVPSARTTAGGAGCASVAGIGDAGQGVAAAERVAKLDWPRAGALAAFEP